MKANWYAEVKRAGSIGRNVFWPAPNVDCGLVSLVRRTEPIKTTASKAEVFAVVDAAFAQRRKTLRAALAGWAGSPAAAEAALVAAGVSPQARGESLTVEEFARDRRARSARRRDPRRAAVERDRTRPRQGQRPAGGGRAPGPTASTTWPTSSSPSALYDEVTVTPADELTRHLRGPGRRPGPAGPYEPRRAGRRAASPPGTASTPAVHIHIAKDIPVAGGMAGGSADGAGALLACDALWGTGRVPRRNCSTSAPSWAATCRSAWSAGRRWAPAAASSSPTLTVGGAFHWVFAVADGGLSTPAVYREFDRLNAGRRTSPSPVASPACSTPSPRATRTPSPPPSSNDLQPAALSLRPSLRARSRRGPRAGALAALVSGSGPTTAFLAEDEDAAAAGRRGAAGLRHVPHGARGPGAGCGATVL